MTRQAVWPQELLDRREAAAALLGALRRAELQAPAGRGHEHPDVVELRSQLAALPCPHWDVHQHAGGLTDWICATCAAVIAPEWVPLEEQERHLRRLRGHRTPGRDGRHVETRPPELVPAR